MEKQIKKLEKRLMTKGEQLKKKDELIEMLNHRINDLEMNNSPFNLKLLNDKEQFINSMFEKIDNLQEDNKELKEENQELKKEIAFLLLEDDNNDLAR